MRAAFLIFAAALVAAPASAAVIVSVEGAGVAAPTLSGYTFVRDTLNGNINGGANLAFGNSGITGTTSSGWITSADANVYGGVGGTGKYGSVSGTATINLSTSVNYFGLWGSALDGNNAVALYNNDTLLGTWALQSVLQGSPTFSNAYFGNPFGGGNTGEAYAFFNFKSDTAFNRVQLIQNGGGGFEFDDLTVGQSIVGAAPDPATWMTMLTGFGLIGWAMRRRRAGGLAGTTAAAH
ncbi:PEPxxWA-CTERM sorting domain-containing protein [Sphingomonas crocodyli]|uniref:PEP-CTERM sorting domain-containing protein n=1 Tax=Sphingomonas crocodyli TaxID=1979270 RepID=A0A437M8E0_9SPHN|nr:PEPxxWA-CTERM sorting domain-containing protein [Sphingomonas crocodyli]RVT93873.1 hypothetical protein EOD43_08430 [Sphingomonas crocodyli]